MEVQPEFDDFTFLNNFTSKYRKVFRKMRDITKHLSRLRCINGLEIIKDCNGSKLEDSRFTENEMVPYLDSYLCLLQIHCRC